MTPTRPLSVIIALSIVLAACAPVPDRPVPDSDSLLANGNFENPLSLDSKVPFLNWRIPMMSGLKERFPRNSGNYEIRR